MNRLDTETRIRIVSALIEGMSVSATCRMVGASKRAVLRLLADMGKACQTYHDENVRGLEPKRVQADELWNFVYAKDKNLPEAMRDKDGVGSTWTWTAIDAESKLLIAWHIGQRNSDCALEFMLDVAGRVMNRCQLTTDAHGAYLPAVLESFGTEIDYAHLIKIYRSPRETEGRYSPCECIGVKSEPKIGMPDHRHVSTSYVERMNLSVRMGNRRYTRLTNAFSKKIENLKHSFALQAMHFNYCRKHTTIKTSPAEYVGLTDHVWTIAELVGVLEAQETAAIVAGSLKRGKYQPRQPKPELN